MNMTQHSALAAAVLLALSAPAGAAPAPADRAAQTDGPPSAYETGDIVVTASGFEEEVRLAPASISVIKAEEIAKRGYTDLRQVLDTVEGVDTFGATGRFDTPNISIRGMDGAYTLIMVDGVAQHGPGIAGGMMRSFNQLANTSLPPVSQIERIEIIRGPMSTLYGADAMGGVVNIITKKVTDETRGNVSAGSLFERTDGKQNMMKYSFNVSGPVTREKVGLQMRGGYLKRGASRYGIDKEARDYDNWSLGTRISYTPSAKSRYYLDIDRGQNMRSGDFAQQMRQGVMQANLRGDMAQRFDRTKVVLNGEHQTGRGTWTNTLSFLRNEMHLNADLSGRVQPPAPPPPPFQMNAAIRNHVKNDFFTFDTKYAVPLGDTHLLTVGGRWQRERVDYRLRRTLTPNTTNPMILNMARQRSSNDTGSLSRSTWALFAEDTWAVSKKLIFTYGLRYDRPEDYDDNLSPRGYLVYRANDYVTVKGGVATGYKAPTMLQSAPVDVHVNVANRVYRGNADLKPETSVTEEIGVYYRSRHATNAHLTFFHSDFKNKIDLGDPDAAGVQTYENIGRARIHGIELGTEFNVAPKVTAGLNWTFLTSRVRSGPNAGQPLRSTPKQAVNLKLDWMPTDATDVWLTAQYRSGMRRTQQAAGLDPNYRASLRCSQNNG